jgi:membrane protease YdiL (CAAX protease family)
MAEIMSDGAAGWLKVRAITTLVAVGDTLLALLMGVPILVVIAIVSLLRLPAPHPDVGIFEPLAAWSIPGEAIDDPVVIALLEKVRASPGLADAPLWLKYGDTGVLLFTIQAPDLVPRAAAALRETGVDPDAVIRYRNSYTFAREAAVAEYQRDPVAYFNRIGKFLPLLFAGGSLGFLIAGWWFRRRRPVEDWDGAGERKLSQVEAVGVGIGVALLGMLATGVAGAISLVAFGLEPAEQPDIISLAQTNGIALWSFLIFAVVVGPIGEELFFRGHIFRWSASRCGLPFGHLVSAALFALMHGFLPGVPAYMAMAVVFAWSYERWRTITVPIVAHIAINSVAISSLIAR